MNLELGVTSYELFSAMPAIWNCSVTNYYGCNT